MKHGLTFEKEIACLYSSINLQRMIVRQRIREVGRRNEVASAIIRVEEGEAKRTNRQVYFVYTAM